MPRPTRFLFASALLIVACSASGVEMLPSGKGLHFTPDELTLWRARMSDPAYERYWSLVAGRARAFLASPQGEFWPGNQLDQPWVSLDVEEGKQAANRWPGREAGAALRDAGFVYLLTGETAYRDAVREALLKQIEAPGADFGNPKKWSVTGFSLTHHGHDIAGWLRRVLYGYDYIRSSLPAAERARIERWFVGGANFFAQVNSRNVRKIFPKRDQDIYAPAPSVKEVKVLTHADGYPIYQSFHSAWFNKTASANAIVGAVGILANDDQLKSQAKRFTKEWLMFAVARDGTVADQHRWADNDTGEMGFAYAGAALGSHISVADHFARAGDPELYAFTTEAGYFGWEGGPKSLRTVVSRFAAMTLAERKLGGGVAVRIGSNEDLVGPGEGSYADSYLAPANLFYKDPEVTRCLARKANLKKAKGGGYDIFSGDWGTYPSVPLMFFSPDPKVNPYPKR